MLHDPRYCRKEWITACCIIGVLLSQEIFLRYSCVYLIVCSDAAVAAVFILLFVVMLL